MEKGRLEAFSDGVIAILITIMVLELNAPQEPSFAALRPLVPVLLSYILSFVYLGIYWNNHHHLFQAVQQVNGRILWANLHLLFWLSLIPFVTAWMGETHFATLPVALYGALLLLSAIAYFILCRVLILSHGQTSTLAIALGADRKGKLSMAIYALAIVLSLVSVALAGLLYVGIAVLWLIPDRRIERLLSDSKLQ